MLMMLGMGKLGDQYVVLPPKDPEGEVLSSVIKSEVLEVGTLHWETDLIPKEGESLVKSPVYQMKLPQLVKWQVEVDPNNVDQEGTRHLSFWVRLIEAEGLEEVVACLAVCLIIPCPDIDYVKEGGVFRYTREKPCFGFPKYIQMYRLKSNGNPGGRFRFRVEIKVFAELRPERDLMKPGAGAGSGKGEGKSAYFKNSSSSTNFDATVVFQGTSIPVDSSKLSFYSSVFKSHFQKRPGETMDVSQFFEVKCTAERVLGFCHSGKLRTVSFRPAALRKMLAIGDKLGMPLLKAACKRDYMKSLKPKYFVDTVELVKEGLLEEKKAMPVLIAFLLKNFDVLSDDEGYRDTYEENEPLYSRYIFAAPKDKAKDNAEDIGVSIGELEL